MPEALVWFSLEVLVLKMDGGDFWGSDSSAVDLDRTESRSWSGLVSQRLRKLEVQDRGWVDSPSMAQDAVRLAVEHSELRLLLRRAYQRDTLVEGSLCPVAHSIASLVPSSNKDHPSLKTWLRSV